MNRKLLFPVGFALLLSLTVGIVLAAPPSGAIFTTTPDGGIVNENVRYELKREVYLDGGPHLTRRKPRLVWMMVIMSSRSPIPLENICYQWTRLAAEWCGWMRVSSKN